MKAFRVVAYVLFVGLLAWLTATAILRFGYRPTPAAVGTERAIQDSPLPAEQTTAAFDAARARMLHVNALGTRFRLAGDIVGWLSFSATAAITLIVGFYGRSPPVAGAAIDTQGLSPRSLRLIGLLAALAAVLTAFGNIAIAKSSDYYRRADQVRELIVRSRTDLAGAKSVDAAQAVLENLALQIAR
jgi:hypothetical protein